MKDSADDDPIGRNSVEDDVFSVNKLVGPALVDPTHARILGYQPKDGVQFAQILLACLWPNLSNV